ncbi:hypothetical protein L596_020233 [Steinernema carpocapsae]|uniref:RanBP2-type domain-containing protein n=1 Tax=Steinernema carpocapsae TaxID=34508 RepID=A0A4U5MSX0_STECR|nr:hypothetical protein L596_020233 [Steinernema carpocapsae]
MSGKKRGGGAGRPSSSKPKPEEFDPGSWECTLCTYRNKYESFKCEICETRKGTSTRKPRLNQNVVHQQTLVQNMALQQSQLEQKAIRRKRASSVARGCTPESESSSSMAASSPAKQGKVTPRNLKRASSMAPTATTASENGNSQPKPIPTLSEDLVDRASAKKINITINGKTIIFTEFKTAKKSLRKSS